MGFLLSLLPSFLKVLLGIGVSTAEKQQQRGDAIELGQRRQETVDQKTALDAESRMDAAGAKPNDDKTTGDDLRGGRF